MVQSVIPRMHEKLWEQLVCLDPEETAARSQCSYVKDEDSYLVRLLNREYQVDIRNKRLLIQESHSEPKPAGYLQQLCILVYLINAKPLRLTNKFVKGTSFPGGLFFFRGLHSLPTEKLVKAFGTRPALLKKATKFLNAENVALEIPLLRL